MAAGLRQRRPRGSRNADGDTDDGRNARAGGMSFSGAENSLSEYRRRRPLSGSPPGKDKKSGRRRSQILSIAQSVAEIVTFTPALACKSRHAASREAQGEMAEWLKAHAWKACVRETVPWVRIPLSPPYRIDM
jgi:hypothetical protein